MLTYVKGYMEKTGKNTSRLQQLHALMKRWHLEKDKVYEKRDDASVSLIIFRRVIVVGSERPGTENKKPSRL